MCCYDYIGHTCTCADTEVSLSITQQCPGMQIVHFNTDDATKKLGSKFGAVLAGVDINGDSVDELFVGAPLYEGTYPEEGRVYVYTSTGQVNRKVRCTNIPTAKLYIAM